jgi:hypothetical protein
MEPVIGIELFRRGIACFGIWELGVCLGFGFSSTQDTSHRNIDGLMASYLANSA